MASNELKEPYIKVTAMVIAWQPMGEYDRRVVLLTREIGKISAFAKGARRPGSQLLAATDIFSFGTFWLYEGRSSYTVREASISNYFDYFRTHMDASLIGQYFLEVCNYCTRENNDEASILLLLYQSLRALSSPAYPQRLVVSIFEIRLVVQEGELPEEFQPATMQGNPGNPGIQGFIPEQHMHYSPATAKAMQTITNAPISALYTFRLSNEAMAELSQIAAISMNQCFDNHHFHSLEVLKLMGII